MKRLPIFVAALLTGAVAIVSHQPASAANDFTCKSVVNWKNGSATGHSVLATTPVNGATITAAASMCHGATLQAFVANKAWSAPDEVCKNTHGRTFDLTKPISVWALDQFAEMPGGYNRVEGYTVECGLKNAVSAFAPTVPHTVTNQ